MIAAGFTFKMQGLLDLTECGRFLVQSDQFVLFERKRELRLPQFRLPRLDLVPMAVLLLYALFLGRRPVCRLASSDVAFV